MFGCRFAARLSMTLRATAVPTPGLLILVLMMIAPLLGSRGPAAADAGPEIDDEWVEATLAGLTLREKVAQLIMPWVSGAYMAIDSEEFDRVRRWVTEDRVGGLIMSIGHPHSYAATLNELQSLAHVPLLITSDMENGAGMRLTRSYSLPDLVPQGGATVFPPLMGMAATGADTLVYQLGRILAREARAVGVHVTFGPVLDVNSNPLNPVINTRSFGEDPGMVGRLGADYIRGPRPGGW
jgi:beta-N-acetylhexosaminidase